jgi:hypothetical protein
VCEIGYRATRRDLRRRRSVLAPMLRRHGLRLRLDVLEDEARDLWEGVGLERGSGAREPVTERLVQALTRLETTAVRPARRRATARAR